MPPLGCPFAQSAGPVKDAAGAAKPFILDWAWRLCYLYPSGWHGSWQLVRCSILSISFSRKFPFAHALSRLDFLFAGSYIDLLPRTAAHYTSIALFVLILEDSIYSAMSFSTFAKKVKALSTELAGATHYITQEVNRRKETIRGSIRRNIALDKLKTFIKRMRAGK